MSNTGLLIRFCEDYKKALKELEVLRVAKPKSARVCSICRLCDWK